MNKPQRHKPPHLLRSHLLPARGGSAELHPRAMNPLEPQLARLWRFRVASPASRLAPCPDPTACAPIRPRRHGWGPHGPGRRDSRCRHRSPGPISLHRSRERAVRDHDRSERRFSPLRRVFEAGVSDADFIIEGVRTIRVEGKVTSRAGDPLESVVILARGGATQTDGAGRYAVELKLHPESPAIAVSPRHPGYRGDQVLLHLEDAAQEGAIALDFVLDPVAKPAQPRILVRERGEGRRDRSYAPLLGSARHTVGMLPANTMTPSVMRPKP
jgi:hypothetical protein